MKSWLTVFISLKLTAITILGLFHILDRAQVQAQKDYTLQLADAHRKANLLASILKTDQERKAAIAKVTSIINNYNPKLSDDAKYKLSNEIFNMTIKYDNLNLDLICATITHESARTWDSTVVSHAGAHGLMQIMPATGKMLAQLEKTEWTGSKNVLFDPIMNIRLGSRYLSMLLTKYEEMGYEREVAVQAALAAYNGGERRVALWLKKNRNYKYLYKETQKYIPYVLALEEEFANISL